MNAPLPADALRAASTVAAAASPPLPAPAQHHEPRQGPGATDAGAPTVHRLAPSDAAGAARWDDFVMHCAEGTFFHRSGWQPVIGGCFGHATHYLYAERAGAIVGVLPLAEVRSRLFGHSLASLPFASVAGIAAADDAARQALQRQAESLARSLGVEHLELRNASPQQPWPTQGLYVDFRMPIPALLDDRMAAIPQKRRNMVRKAAKLGLRAVPDDSVGRFFPVFARNARDHGTPTLPRRFFDALVDRFGADCRILSVDDAQGHCISSIMCFFHKGTVLAYYAGETPAARGTAANDFKYWHVMKWAQAAGCTEFDIGRSKQGTGSYEFKRLWGFQPHPLHYQYLLLRRDAIPQNNPNNPKYRLLIAAWQRLPMPVANWLGPRIVRSLG